MFVRGTTAVDLKFVVQQSNNCHPWLWKWILQWTSHNQICGSNLSYSHTAPDFLLEISHLVCDWRRRLTFPWTHQTELCQVLAHQLFDGEEMIYVEPGWLLVVCLFYVLLNCFLLKVATSMFDRCLITICFYSNSAPHVCLSASPSHNHSQNICTLF